VKEVPFKAIPYSTWNNRGADQMAVWIPEAAEYARPTPEPTIASKAHTLMIQAPIQKDAPESASVETWAWGVNDQCFFPAFTIFIVEFPTFRHPEIPVIMIEIQPVHFYV